MKDWKVTLILSILLALFPLFFLLSSRLCIGASSSLCVLNLIMFAVFSVPLAISLLSTVVFLKNITKLSLIILVLSFLNLIVMILVLNNYSYLYSRESSIIIIIIIFEIIPSVLLFLVNFRKSLLKVV